MSIKIFKMCYFTFKLNERKIMWLKKVLVSKGGFEKKFSWRGCLMYNWGVGNVPKKEDLTRKGWRKIEGNYDPQRSLWYIYALWYIYFFGVSSFFRNILFLLGWSFHQVESIYATGALHEAEDADSRVCTRSQM